MISDALSYPFKGAGLLVILLGTVFGMILQVAASTPVLGLIALLFYFGYFSAYYFQILQHTATGSDREPEWPDISDFLDDIISPAFQVFCVLLISNALWIAGAIMYDPDHALAVGGRVFGLFYFPMALLAVVIMGNINAANPLRVLTSIAKTLPTYAVVGAVLVCLSYVVDVISTYLPGPDFIVWGISTFLLLTFITAHARLLGLFYRQEEEKLDWL